MKMFEFGTARSMSIVFACLIASLVLILVLTTDKTSRFGVIGEFGRAMFQGGSSLSSAASAPGIGNNVPEREITNKERLLGGLLAAGLDEGTCFSRYQSVQYRKPSPYHPSPYLVSKLRSYEDLHTRCGPQTKSYNMTLDHLRSGKTGASPTDCNYVIWLDCSGLGNKILSMASAFLYAFLTNRVFLIQQKPDMVNLFCEPFPNSSWILPPDFPVRLHELDKRHGNAYGNLVRSHMVNTSLPDWPPSFLYIHLLHDYSYHDKLFFCDEYQEPLINVPWLIIKSNLYFLPSLFTIPSFQKELSMIFPNKETVFHHLGRYLLHPSNQVWGLITRFYRAYLARADEIVGIQIRVFDQQRSDPLPHVMEQIESCTIKQNILPALNTQEAATSAYNKSLKAVLVASLYPGYYEHMRDQYLVDRTVTMEAVAFHQPSHEGHQQSGNNMHNMKAWSEIYLLSISDVLVTTSWSTFGYVGNSLAGLRPWILSKPVNRTAPDPPCIRAKSMEPCLQAPPNQSCKVKDQNGSQSLNVSSFLRACEENYGAKLYDDSELLGNANVG